MKKYSVKSFLNHTPLFFGLIYLGLIPLFGLIYLLFPTNEFKTELNIANIWTCLYYSTVTITTLGFGDISPVSEIAQIVTMIESILGLVVIGLFLNSIALLKSALDVEDERIKNEKNKYSQERIKLLRHNKIVQSNIEFYNIYAAIVATPISKRKDGNFNKNFTFNDLRDLFKPTLRLTDSHFEPGIKYYFTHLKTLEQSINNMLLSIDFSYWPELENLCFDFLKACKILDFSQYILKQPQLIAGEQKCSDSDAESIENYKGEIEFAPSWGLNPYVALYLLIKKNIDFIEKYQINIKTIIDNIE